MGWRFQSFVALQSLFLALSLHPDAQKKAQAELDAVVGPHRLPEFSDLKSLVYVNAVIRETLRWHTVVPLSVAHAAIADDELHGYFIPSGTVLLPNIWSVLPGSLFVEDSRLTLLSCAGLACMTRQYTKTLTCSDRNVSFGMGNSTRPSGILSRSSSVLDEGST